MPNSFIFVSIDLSSLPLLFISIVKIYAAPIEIISGRVGDLARIPRRSCEGSKEISWPFQPDSRRGGRETGYHYDI